MDVLTQINPLPDVSDEEDLIRATGGTQIEDENGFANQRDSQEESSETTQQVISLPSIEDVHKIPVFTATHTPKSARGNLDEF